MQLSKKEVRVIKPPTMEIKLPPYILSDNKRFVRAVVDTTEYSISNLKFVSNAISIGNIRPYDCLVFQYFDKSYSLINWNQEREISDDDRKYFICEIAVYYEPSKRKNVVDPIYTIENYKTDVMIPNN